MDSYYPHLKQSLITDHFVKLSKGERPLKKKGIVLIPQVGGADLKLVSPSQDAVEQAHSDLKRGIDQVDIYQDALRQDAKRKRLSQSAAASRKRSLSKHGKKKKASSKKGSKKTGKKNTKKSKSKSRK